MLEPEDYQRIAEACRHLAERSGGSGGRARSQGGYLVALAERFDREAEQASRAFAGSKPKRRKPAARR